MEGSLTIGQLAKSANVTLRTLRYYDKISLLKPCKYDENGTRLYSYKDLDKLKQIQSLKFLGLSLKEIDDILKNKNTDIEYLKETIYYKKQKCIEEIEEIQKTVEKLNMMNAVINGNKEIDVSIFCFILYSMIWEEQHYDANKFELINPEERIEMNKTYFNLFLELKQLVNKKIPYHSPETQDLMKKIHVTLSDTLSLQIETVRPSSVNDFELYNPFTEEEKEYLKKAYEFASKMNGN
ncbi:MerR family transcriptional regulator [Oceanobacillus piezotolerans]|uniref:MerR family transcriptional regulator n=1 Tax=Oceanobacillus piezotolerans TaxID=2448030 RepID=A0A498DA25_9BACI|nr:MerR family transcriptional regulator [Oceanobacillus piezotolerans]RLL43790.1 MerR family transcriptional regulator [Oceanobacillus piezotolerans]